MKLLRFGEAGHERPGLLDAQGRIRDLYGVIADLGPEEIAGLDKIAALDPASLPLVDGTPRIGSCVARPSKILAIGLNYVQHAAEAGVAPPTEPIVFMKASSALCGPNDPTIMPLDGAKLDWEIELGVVIGRKARYVSEAEAPRFIAGYCTTNDISERAFQLERLGQWTKGKSAGHFAPIGPHLVTADEIPDPQALKLFCAVNGRVMQKDTTANMIFGVYPLISYISRFMTLLPGDVIMAGTPEGVGLGMKPPVFLNVGDTIHCGIERLGEQNHTVVREGHQS